MQVQPKIEEAVKEAKADLRTDIEEAVKAAKADLRTDILGLKQDVKDNSSKAVSRCQLHVSCGQRPSTAFASSMQDIVLGGSLLVVLTTLIVAVVAIISK
jgi:hypothetical protein